MCGDPLDSAVDVIDVDVWQQTGLTRYHAAGHPAADEVSGRIIKSGIIGVVPPYIPAEDLLISVHAD